MKILITNEMQIQTYVENEPHVVISIQDPSCDFVRLSEQNSRKGWIGLKFDDINIDSANTVIFNKLHAKTIINFYNEWKNKVDLIVIHCVVGVCRSPAVGAALLKINEQSDMEMFKRYCPNMLVYKTILETYYGQKEKNR